MLVISFHKVCSSLSDLYYVWNGLITFAFKITISNSKSLLQCNSHMVSTTNHLDSYDVSNCSEYA